jgi:ATP-binding cassette subfamily F protein 3
MACLLLSNLEKSFGEDLLFENVSLEVGDNDRIGLVGVNGSGKTSLFRMIIGEMSPDGGTVSIGKHTRVGYMEQHVCKNLEITVYDEVLTVFRPLMEMERELEKIQIRLQQVHGSALETLIEQQTALRERFEAEGGLTYRSRTRSALMGLGFTEEQLQSRVGILSGGQKAKLQLAKMLLSGADLMLLDEPTNHLDIASVEWLEDFLKGCKGAFIVISHDRYFLDRVTNRTAELENHHLTVYNGNYTRSLALKEEAKVAAQRRYSNTRKEIARLEGVVAQQRQWNREKNIKTAESKLKMIARLEDTLERPEDAPETFHFKFEIDHQSGNDVLEMKDVALSFGNKPLFSNVNINLYRGERVFLLGANGCGKTSLLRILLGQYRPNAGSVKLGVGVSVGYYDQIQQGLSGSGDVITELWNRYPSYTQTQVRSALAMFLFKGDDVFKPISALSGGEKARLLLLELMLAKDNFLLLDEPTNHLDIHSREALENALTGYPGTMFIVSHDRYFINKEATRILVLDENGVTAYDGNYDAYLEKRAAQAASVQPEIRTEAPKVNAYKLQKERGAELRKLKTRLKKAEEAVAAAEEKVAELEARFELPEIAGDYQNMMALTQELDAAKENLDELYMVWMECNEAWEQANGGEDAT